MLFPIKFKPRIALWAGIWLIATSSYAQSIPRVDYPWHLLDGPGAKDASSIRTAQIQPVKGQIVVAVLDSGIVKRHPALDGRLLDGADVISKNNIRGGRSTNYEPDATGAYCEQSGNSYAQWNRYHGTEVASVIAGNGSGGVHGVNKEAHILPVRVHGACPNTKSDLIDAIYWSVGLPVAGLPLNKNPAKIINLSLSGGAESCSASLSRALLKVEEMGVYVVAAAGNNKLDRLEEPAVCSTVISAGSLNFDNTYAASTPKDPRITVFAPGGFKQYSFFGQQDDSLIRVASFVETDKKESPVAAQKGAGASYSAAIVSGFLSLWLSHYPDMEPKDFRAILERSGRRIQVSESECSGCKPLGLDGKSFMEQAAVYVMEQSFKRQLSAIMPPPLMPVAVN